MQTMAVVAAPALSSRVELFLSATNLAKMDLLSQSDPYVVVYALSPPAGPRGGGSSRTELGRSEVIWDCPSPEWTKRFEMEYHFELNQALRFELFDKDAHSDDALGYCETTLGRIMAARGQSLTVPLVGPGARPNGASTLTIRGAEIAGTTDELRCRVRCAGLERKNFFGLGSSDPFFAVSRVRPDGSRQRVWVSKPQMGNLNPSWPGECVKVSQLCNGDPAMRLVVEVWDYNASGAHELIGGFESSLNGWLEGAKTGAEYPLVNPKRAGKSGYKHSGVFALHDVAIVRIPTLLDYIRGGLQLNLVAAVDFTGSNGDPRQPSSLHYLHGASPNEYLQALQAVGEILLVRADVCVGALCVRACVRACVWAHCACALGMRARGRAPTCPQPCAPRTGPGVCAPLAYACLPCVRAPRPLVCCVCRSTTRTNACHSTALVAPSTARRGTASRSTSMTRSQRWRGSP